MSATVTASPGLSFAERDRRWAVVRSLMREHQADYLLVAGFRAREMYQNYIADDYNEGCVVFPLEGDPLVLTWTHLRFMRARDSAARGYPIWAEDYLVATSGTAAATVLRDKGFSENGKSDEELAQVRYAALAAEDACRAIQQVAAAGVGKEVFLAVATEAIYRRGIATRYPSIVMNSGPHTLSWRPPRWATRGEPPRRLQPGDLLQAELMPTCGNQEIQVQMAVALDPLDEINKRCETAAQACYDARRRAALQPGMTFSELVEAMSEPLKDYGCWSYTPLVQSISPHFLIGFTPVNSQSVDLGVRYVDSRPMLPPRAPCSNPEWCWPSRQTRAWATTASISVEP